MHCVVAFQASFRFALISRLDHLNIPQPLTKDVSTLRSNAKCDKAY